MVDRVGQQLGNYRITQLLGRGGFADVYLGEHVYLKTPAAIKVLQTRLSGEDDMESFLKEARIIAGLTHPNIVRVLDFGVDNETPFLVMDYAPKGTLRQRHPRGSQLPLSTILPYVKQVADALQYAHEEKFIHRDVKPENMLVGKRNEILLSDFGIALVAQSSRNQSTQDVTGTVAYMSPEQIQGRPRPASDQYSLAIVVYEWLGSTPPFRGSFTELCTQHMFAPPPPLREKVPTLSPDVEQVVMTALSKEPKQRFGSVQAFVNALEQASHSHQPVAPPPPPIQSAPPSTPTPRVIPALPTISVAPSPTIGYVNRVSSPDAHLFNTGDSAKGRSVTDSPHDRVVTPEKAEKKFNAWTIGKTQGRAMLIVLVLAVILGSFSGWYLANHFQNVATAVVLLGVFEAIPLFFAALYGPWVGLFTGSIGFFVAGFFFTSTVDSTRGISVTFNYYLSSYRFSWTFLVALSFIGFVAGLVTIKTKGRYNTLLDILYVELIDAITLVVVVAFIALLTHTFYGIGSTLLLTLLGLAPLFVFLFIWSRVTRNKKASA